jgi:hypothetical protein
MLLITGCWSAQSEPINLVAAVDLSASEAVKGHDGKSQFSKNIEGMSHLLAEMPAGSKVTVIGITENSFGDPYILLKAEISNDPGYFNERLAAARGELVRTWAERSAQLAPTVHGTDILGALLLASGLLRDGSTARKKILVLYSDMRHVTRDLDLESPRRIHVDPLMATVQSHRLLADLKSVTVYVLGADAQGGNFVTWDGLRQFWTFYFKSGGANLSSYSALLEPPKLLR